jgi:hypothetical protein
MFCEIIANDVTSQISFIKTLVVMCGFMWTNIRFSWLWLFGIYILGQVFVCLFKCTTILYNFPNLSGPLLCGHYKILDKNFFFGIDDFIFLKIIEI